MIDTGKVLTPEQIDQVKAEMNRPVLLMSGGHRIGGDDTPQTMVHRFALANGLPEVSGYYGADLSTGKIYQAD